MRNVFFILLFIFFLINSCGSPEESMNLGLYQQRLSLDTALNVNSEYMVVIGDIQGYTKGDGNDRYYGVTMNWIYSQYFWGYKIKRVLQLGDITENNDWLQYELFYKYTLPVAQYIPYIACIGNHDYVWDEAARINDRTQTLFTEYTSFELTKSLIVDRFEKGRMENIIVKNEIGGSLYYILSLEFGPRTEVLEWANRFVKKHPDHKFILMTHEFLTRKGKRISSGSDSSLQLKNTSWNSPEQVWQQLVKDNDNIFCVLCGHNGFFSYLMSNNASGRLVPQILFNLQYLENGGNGWIQLWEFPQNSDSVNIGLYNTLSREWNSDAGKLKLRYKY